jgi:hypothetical protein
MTSDPVLPDAPTPATAPALLPGHACLLFRADDVFVVDGVNTGDGLSAPSEVCAGDIYMIDEGTRPLRLVLAPPGAGDAQRIGAGSQIGRPGEALRLEARHTLMTPDGEKVDLLALTLDDGSRFALPLSPMGLRTEYQLLQTDTAPEETPLADLLCVSFARGTMITLATGAQVAIESLAPGDRVLTRDHGPQPIRWIGRATLRGVGAFAPVVIPKGTLGNAGDLIVSQHHRMFLYQRRRPEGFGTSELLVQAKHLVDGDRVFIREGAVVDYFSLVFDRHEIIYAEGVPAESLMVNEATLSRLPPEMAAEVKARFPGLSQRQHFGTEAGRQLLDEIGTSSLFQFPRSDGRGA